MLGRLILGLSRWLQAVSAWLERFAGRPVVEPAIAELRQRYPEAPTHWLELVARQDVRQWEERQEHPPDEEGLVRPKDCDTAREDIAERSSQPRRFAHPFIRTTGQFRASAPHAASKRGGSAQRRARIVWAEEGVRDLLEPARSYDAGSHRPAPAPASGPGKAARNDRTAQASDGPTWPERANHRAPRVERSRNGAQRVSEAHTVTAPTGSGQDSAREAAIDPSVPERSRPAFWHWLASWFPRRRNVDAADRKSAEGPVESAAPTHPYLSASDKVSQARPAFSATRRIVRAPGYEPLSQPSSKHGRFVRPTPSDDVRPVVDPGFDNSADRFPDLPPVEIVLPAAPDPGPSPDLAQRAARSEAIWNG